MRGSIVKKGDRYYVVYYVGGKHRWKAAGTKKKDAERMLTEIVRQVQIGEYRDPRPITFGEISEKWMEYAEHQLKPATLSLYRTLLNVHILPEFEKNQITDIWFEDIQRFISRKAKEGKLSPQTLKHMMNPISGVFQYAIRGGYLRENPARYVQTPRIPHREMDFLTTEEVRIFLEYVPQRYYSLFLTAIMTGMRRGELLAMKWKNLDWNRRQYFVREILSKYGARFQEPKSKTSRRAMDLAPQLIGALEAHRAHQNEMKLKLGPVYEDMGLVFCTEKGTPLDPDNISQREFPRFLKDAGIRRIRFHDLRHTYASLLIAQGESPKYIQNQMGHASIRTTLDRYGHLMPEVHEQAAKRLGNQIFGRDFADSLEIR